MLATGHEISNICPDSAPVTIQERGCAHQVYTYQNLDRGQWRTVTTILEDTYTPGCIKDREWAEHLATDTEWCYCDTDRYVLVGVENVLINVSNFLNFRIFHDYYLKL